MADSMIIKGLKKETPLLTASEKLLGWYGGSSLPDRLAQAGYPKAHWGKPGPFLCRQTDPGAVPGAAFQRIIIFAGIQPGGIHAARRPSLFGGQKEEIRRSLPEMLDFLRRALAGGSGMRETLAAFPDHWERR